MSVIATESLTRRYGARTGIEGMDLRVPEGALFGFLGPNGSGKTTTIRVLLGLLRPSEGAARVFGLDCWRHSARIKREIGYLPGDLRLYPWMNGERALRVLGSIRGRDMMPEGRALAARFALDLTVRVPKMSRGMRQKLGLILAMAHRPKLLILDEPTAALDPLMQDRLHQHLRSLAAAGHTVFFSSHALGEVEALCDCVAILREGRLVAASTLDDLRSRSRRKVTIRWKTPEDASRPAPAFLDVRQRDHASWTCLLAGPIEDLLRWASAQPLEDIAIGQPDLEMLFQQYYRGGDGQP